MASNAFAALTVRAFNQSWPRAPCIGFAAGLVHDAGMDTGWMLRIMWVDGGPGWGECALGYPSTDAPLALWAAMALCGATRRCILCLLGGTRRDDGLWGALGIGGCERGCKRVGRSGAADTAAFAPFCCVTMSLTSLWRRVAPLLVADNLLCLSGFGAGARPDSVSDCGCAVGDAVRHAGRLCHFDSQCH